jgi:hypothetical protein
MWGSKSDEETVMANENNNRPGQQRQKQGNDRKQCVSGYGNPDQGGQGERDPDKGRQQGDQGRQSGGGGGSTDPDRRRDQRDQQIGGRDLERQGDREPNAM